MNADTGETAAYDDAPLRELRLRLLRLHKVLLDAERAEYERVNGRTSAGEMLRLVIGHEQFAWLRAVSELIVRIDETLDSDEPPTAESARELFDFTRALLKPSEGAPGFAGRYYELLQREPEAVIHHAEIIREVMSDK
jgi:hypothetical protein